MIEAIPKYDRKDFEEMKVSALDLKRCSVYQNRSKSSFEQLTGFDTTARYTISKTGFNDQLFNAYSSSARPQNATNSNIRSEAAATTTSGFKIMPNQMFTKKETQLTAREEYMNSLS